MTTAERELLEYCAGLIPLPVRWKPEEDRRRFHEWGWSPMEAAIDVDTVEDCRRRGWLSLPGDDTCHTTALGILALGQL